jgi:soluble lytic murein transglycosylase
MGRFAPWRVRVGSVLVVFLVAYTALLGLRLLYPIAYTAQLIAFAEEHALDPALVAAVVRCESRFKARAVSPRGATGLMQVMPDTGAWIAQQLEIPDFEPDRLTEPALNLRLGTWYLRHLLDRFGNEDDALAAYNAGPSNAEHWADGSGSVFPETRAYVERVSRSVPVYRLYFAAPWLLRITPSLLL